MVQKAAVYGNSIAMSCSECFNINFYNGLVMHCEIVLIKQKVLFNVAKCLKKPTFLFSKMTDFKLL